MIRWHLASLRIWLAVLTAIQVLAGAGFVLGIALFFAHIPARVALFVATGVPVLNLIMLGLLVGPQMVADQKVQRGYEFLRTLPVPHTATAAAWYTVCLAAGLPGVVISLATAEARYGIALDVSAAIIPALLLTALAGTMLGYALGHAMGSPMATRLITQILIFAEFGFNPVLFPARQLPHWLASLDWWLPFGHMAVIVRAGLTMGVVTAVTSSYVIVSTWGLAGAVVTGRVLGRRQ